MNASTLLRLLIGGGLAVLVLSQTELSPVVLLLVAFLVTVVFAPARRSAVS